MNFLIVGDMVNSRSDCSKAHKDFNFVADKINNHYRSILNYPLTITLGDEFQLVVKGEAEADKIVVTHQKLMSQKGWSMRYAIVPFPDTTLIEDVMAALPHFNTLATPELTIARKMVDNLKKGKRKLKKVKSLSEKQRKSNLGLGLDYKDQDSILKLISKS